MRSILIAAVMLGAGSARADRYGFAPATVYNIPRGDSPAQGPADAPVTIDAWSDFACDHCNRVQATLDELVRLYPAQLRFVHRTLPLDDDNVLAAEAGLAAAAQGRFAPMKDRLYGIAGRVDRVGVELIARDLGLDMIRFRADLDTHAFRAAIAADIADAERLGLTGTPMFFVNGRPVHGDQPLEVFAKMVDDELIRAAQTPGPDRYLALVADGRARADAAYGATNEHRDLDPRKPYRMGLGLPGHQLGPDDAPVTLVEWSDFQCPYCAKTEPMLAHARAKYGDRIRIVYRHMPLAGHRFAMLAAEAGVAAAEQGKFWAFHDQVWAHFGHLTRADLETYATAAGLDLPAFRVALDTRRYHDTVVAEAAAASALGVDATPTLFVNGMPLIGSRDEVDFDKVIANHLSIAASAVKQGLRQGDIYAILMSAAEDAERADPSRVPVDSTVHLEPRADDRARSVAAACRRHDGKRAGELAAPLAGDPRRRAAFVCSVEGIDLR